VRITIARAVLAALAVSACSDPESHGLECETDADCGAGQKCRVETGTCYDRYPYALGAICLQIRGTGIDCGDTGVLLTVYTDAIEAPKDFDALQLIVTSELFRTFEKPYDLLSDDLADYRDPDRDNRVIFPLQGLVLGGGSTGIEVFFAMDAYLCKVGAGPTRSHPLSDAELLTCTANPDNRVGTNMGKSVGDGERMVITVKLESGKIKEQPITIARFGPTCEDNDNDGYAVGEGCSPLDCDDSNHSINPGQTESCDDAVDNNCNGLLNEACPCDGPDTPPICYTGPPDSCPPLGCRGVCQKGEQQCEDGSWSTVCYGEVTPTDDLCDSVDNDCDGLVDNNGSDNGIECDTGLPDHCAAGHTYCEQGSLKCAPDDDSCR